MTQKTWTKPSLPVPLLYRLCDFHDDEIETEQIPWYKDQNLSGDDLFVSVQMELNSLLNTRITSCSLTEAMDMLEKNETVPPSLYGLPDLSNFDPSNSFSQDRLAEFMRKIISAFEPRIKNMIIKVTGFTEGRQQLGFSIQGDLMIEDQVVPITFPVAVDV